MCNNHTNLSALLTPFPLLLFRWFIDADVAGGLLADIDSRGPADGFQEPSNGCSPAFNFPQSLLSFLRDKSMSDVAAEYECSGCDTHGADRLSRDEKKPCCDILWPICGLGIPSLELTISEMTKSLRENVRIFNKVDMINLNRIFITKQKSSQTDETKSD